MDIEHAFDALQAEADADPAVVAKARERRDLFNTAFSPLDDVVEVIPSGSLARNTQRDPINDVDLVIIFDPAHHHSEWGSDGSSAGDALDYVQEKVRELLGSTEGSVAQEVRLARPGNHAVKCFLDDPKDPDAFTVDAMPAFRHEGGHLVVPEKANEKWIETDPEYLIRWVERRHEDWAEFRSLVRILKMWNQDVGASMKSLTTEVLALNHLPAEVSRSRALQRFFSAAELAIDQPVEDPAGHCGEIQSDLDLDKVRKCLGDAATKSWRACDAQDAGDDDAAACLWHEVFGDAFPGPDGGCPKDDGGGAGALGAGVGIGITRPRPVKHAPQG